MGGIDSPVLGWIGGGENASASPLVSKSSRLTQNQSRDQMKTRQKNEADFRVILPISLLQYRYPKSMRVSHVISWRLVMKTRLISIR